MDTRLNAHDRIHFVRQTWTLVNFKVLLTPYEPYLANKCRKGRINENVIGLARITSFWKSRCSQYYSQCTSIKHVTLFGISEILGLLEPITIQREYRLKISILDYLSIYDFIYDPTNYITLILYNERILLITEETYNRL